MKLKIVLSTASALALLAGAAGAAWAGSSNTLFIEQQGTGNVGSVYQSGGAGGNDIANQSDPVTQQGDRNQFIYSNKDSNGSGTDNDILKAEQTGNDNLMSTSNWNGSNGNRVNDAQQVGNGNQARFSMNGSDTGGIGTALQNGNNNHLVVEQESQSSAAQAGNWVNSVKMIGSNNGLAPDANGAARRAGVYILQRGASNTVTESLVEGSDNTGPYAGSGGFRGVHVIKQTGVGNGSILSTAITKGSNGNRIWVTETGAANQFDVRQGTDTSSTQNFVTLSQIGTGNTATVAQTNSFNTANLSFTGNSNGASDSLGNRATGFNSTIAGAFDSRGLDQGTVIQNNTGSSTNTITYTVLGNENLFAFKQLGTGNTINGTVGSLTDSNKNQVAIVQTGSSNNTTFSQTGSGSNSLSVSQ